MIPTSKATGPDLGKGDNKQENKEITVLIRAYVTSQNRLEEERTQKKKKVIHGLLSTVDCSNLVFFSAILQKTPLPPPVLWPQTLAL